MNHYGPVRRELSVEARERIAAAINLPPDQLKEEQAMAAGGGRGTAGMCWRHAD